MKLWCRKLCLIQSTIYLKPTEKQSYLMYDSFHPEHRKQSIIYSQVSEYNHICLETAKRNHHLKTRKVNFINRSYNPMIVDQNIHAATRIPRSHLLQYKQKPEINRVPLVFTYNPQLRTLRKIARDLQARTLLTRSALLHPTKNGTYPCGKKQCKTCPHILISDKIPIPDTLEEYNIHGHYNCSSSNMGLNLGLEFMANYVD
ncbi:hypothetical protein XELAEV_18022660mg [Xenopus laevis]|uniref:Helix-turn-helix domain-containing protein n=1 Tax=Xenopus laevis TaxID=8355 RepID=A0A974D5B5_XENLA|nr:hypothetical protein XELAEV_18022660mg [Xenopus laevis]